MFAASLTKIAISLLMSLVTEAFIKKSLIAALEKLAKKTESDLDDQLVKNAKEAWGLHLKDENK